MAYLIKRPDSPYWWISSIDPRGKRVRKSTSFKTKVPNETRRARNLCDELTRREQTYKETDGAEQWEKWVPRFLNQRYRGTPSYEDMLTRWRNVQAFLEAEQIHVPRQLTRQQIRYYHDEWRVKAKPDLGMRAVQKNTALLEIKLLAVVMDEAVRSDFVMTNPCYKIGIKKEAHPKTPPITDEEHRHIILKLREDRRNYPEREWMLIAYRIAYWQGCRLSETCVPMNAFDLSRNVFRTHTKGKKDKSVAEFPLSGKIRPLIRRLIKQGKTMTYPEQKAPSKQFWNFLQHRARLKHLSFHSTRVSFITRCYQRGIPREHVKRLAGHTDDASHEIYPRLGASEKLLQDLMATVAA